MEVKFQPKAWADREVCSWYARKVVPTFVSKNEENIIFLDNLGRQTTKDVIDAYKQEAHTKIHFFKSDCNRSTGIGKKTVRGRET